MTKIYLDKVGSVLKNLNLDPHVELTNDLSCEMGTVLAAEVLEDKSLYNNFELVSGRMSVLKKGDIIAVHNETGTLIARGISTYGSEDARKIIGKQSGDIEMLLGYSGRAELIHRDDLVMEG